MKRKSLPQVLLLATLSLLLAVAGLHASGVTDVGQTPAALYENGTALVAQVDDAGATTTLAATTSQDVGTSQAFAATAESTTGTSTTSSVVSAVDDVGAALVQNFGFFLAFLTLAAAAFFLIEPSIQQRLAWTSKAFEHPDDRVHKDSTTMTASPFDQFRRSAERTLGLDQDRHSTPQLC